MTVRAQIYGPEPAIIFKHNCNILVGTKTKLSLLKIILGKRVPPRKKNEKGVALVPAQ